jgi:hypothetical protein
MVDLTHFKPLEKESNNTVKEVPEHSMGIDPMSNRLQIKADSGKFMDTVYEYTEWKTLEDGNIGYDCWIQSLFINGLSLNTNQMTIEQSQEFQDYVATPIFKHILASIVEFEKEKIEPDTTGE